MTRACQCGGIIRQHQLTGEREAWTCGGCGRYGAISRAAQSCDYCDDLRWVWEYGIEEQWAAQCPRCNWDCQFGDAYALRMGEPQTEPRG